MSTITCTAVVLGDDPEERDETMAVAGFLAGYGAAARTSYATDLRIFAACGVKPAPGCKLKRSLSSRSGGGWRETGRMRSTVAGWLFTLASF